MGSAQAICGRGREVGDKGDSAGTGPQGHIDEPDIEEVHPSVWAWVSTCEERTEAQANAQR